MVISRAAGSSRAALARARRVRSWHAAAGIAFLLAAEPVLADDAKDCFSEGSDRRMEGCAALIAAPDLDAGIKSLAHAMRGLALAQRGEFEEALPDHDAAISLDPASAMALNNRAWTLFKLNQPERALRDAERSISLAPASPHAYDTRAHIRQSRGEHAPAMQDYERAMRLGGERIVRLYQCGLQAQGYDTGSVEGVYTREMRRALASCVGKRSCDPLPPDEECRFVTS